MPFTFCKESILFASSNEWYLKHHVRCLLFQLVVVSQHRVHTHPSTSTDTPFLPIYSLSLSYYYLLLWCHLLLLLPSTLTTHIHIPLCTRTGTYLLCHLLKIPYMMRNIVQALVRIPWFSSAAEAASWIHKPPIQTLVLSSGWQRRWIRMRMRMTGGAANMTHFHSKWRRSTHTYSHIFMENGGWANIAIDANGCCCWWDPAKNCCHRECRLRCWARLISILATAVMSWLSLTPHIKTMKTAMIASTDIMAST